MTKIAILGGGSWGTALAIVLSRSHKPHEISLWMRDAALAASVQQSRENDIYLPGCRVPPSVEITCDLATALEKARHCGWRDTFRACARNLYAKLVLCWKCAACFCQRDEGAGAIDSFAHERSNGPDFRREIYGGAAHRRPFRPVLCAGSGARRPDGGSGGVVSESVTPETCAADGYIQAGICRAFFRDLYQRRRGGRGAGRRDEKRDCHRRGRLPGTGAGNQRDRGPDNPRPGGNVALAWRWARAQKL